jgi:hypothetical protein
MRRIIRWLRCFWQRRTRGWDDSDTWSLDHCFAKMIVPRLRRFRELNDGHPNNLTWEQWEEMLGKMIRSFEFIASDDYWDVTMPREYVQEGLDLFAEYYCSLWW